MIRWDTEVLTEWVCDIDEEEWDEERLEHFSRYFSDVYSPEDVLQHVVTILQENGHDTYVEGIGYIKVNGQYPMGVTDGYKCKSISIEMGIIY